MQVLEDYLQDFQNGQFFRETLVFFGGVYHFRLKMIL